MQAAPRFDSPEMTDSDVLLIALEEHLRPEAFAGVATPKSLAECRILIFLKRCRPALAIIFTEM